MIGHDWGAQVAWLLAANHPTRVKTLTAVSVPHPRALGLALRTRPSQRLRFAYMGVFRASYRGAAAAGRQRPGAAADDGADQGPGRPRTPTRCADPGRLTGGLNWYRALSRSQLAGTGTISVPTTYVWSDKDPVVGLTAALRTADWVDADYQLVAFKGVSHWVPEEAPRRARRRGAGPNRSLILRESGEPGGHLEVNGRSRRWRPRSAPCRDESEKAALGPQLRRPAAGAAGRADRRADPLRVPADPAVQQRLPQGHRVPEGHLRRRADRRRVRHRDDHLAGGVPPRAVPAGPQTRAGPLRAPDGHRRPGVHADRDGQQRAADHRLPAEHLARGRSSP